MDNGKNRIVVTEIPYMVNKERLIGKIGDLVKNKRIDGITALRDKSDRTGMRIVIMSSEETLMQMSFSTDYSNILSFRIHLA